MRVMRVLWQQHRQPMIKFLGKRNIPKEIDHSPHAHPASPDHSLPESFASYRGRAQQHGPLGSGTQQSGGDSGSSQSSAGNGATQQPQRPPTSAMAGGGIPEPYGAIGGHSGRQLGSVQPEKGQFWDRNELPARFRRSVWTESEMDAVDSAGASMWN